MSPKCGESKVFSFEVFTLVRRRGYTGKVVRGRSDSPSLQFTLELDIGRLPKLELLIVRLCIRVRACVCVRYVVCICMCMCMSMLFGLLQGH